jgi:cytoplasmic iron level regulating protein YaaA (DUF328/UPF0246 family)
MITVISPSKTQNFDLVDNVPFTFLRQQDKTLELVNLLKGYSVDELMSLMSLSNNLAKLNHDRFQSFSPEFNLENSKQAFFAFKGDVYSGIQAETLTQNDLEFAQSSIRMLSGLYGVIRPLDLIQPYRLEFGIRMPNSRGSNLYKFWGSDLTDIINSEESSVMVNLASNEYLKGIDKNTLDARILNIVFKELKNDTYKVIAIHAKRARGLMVNFIIKNRITDYNQLKSFAVSGYLFNDELSSHDNFTFTRD